MRLSFIGRVREEGRGQGAHYSLSYPRKKISARARTENDHARHTASPIADRGAALNARNCDVKGDSAVNRHVYYPRDPAGPPEIYSRETALGLAALAREIRIDNCYEISLALASSSTTAPFIALRRYPKYRRTRAWACE